MKSFLSKPTLGFQISSRRKREKENEESFVKATKREVLLVTFDDTSSVRILKMSLDFESDDSILILGRKRLGCRVYLKTRLLLLCFSSLVLPS